MNLGIYARFFNADKKSVKDGCASVIKGNAEPIKLLLAFSSAGCEVAVGIFLGIVELSYYTDNFL